MDTAQAVRTLGDLFDEQEEAGAYGEAVILGDQREAIQTVLVALENYGGLLGSLAAMPTTDEIDHDGDPEKIDPWGALEVLDQYIVRAREIVK